MALTTSERVRAMREGGAVERSHTIPHLDSYTVGLHSYNAVSLLMLLHPNPSRALIEAVLWHDVPERWLGDLPATAKWLNPELKAAYGRAERKVIDRLGIPMDDFMLTEDDWWWLNAVDRLEFWLWALDQHMSGNMHTKEAYDNITSWIEDNFEKLPEQCRSFFREHEHHRLPDQLILEDK